MNIVDSSAWLCYFAGESNAAVFAKPIKNLAQLIVPSITLVEVFKRILQQKDETAALQAVAHMQQGKVVALDNELAITAAHFGVKYTLPLADSIIYATVYKYQATLWTQDADFKDLEQVKYFKKIIH